jgi:hypothetical protein
MSECTQRFVDETELVWAYEILKTKDKDSKTEKNTRRQDRPITRMIEGVNVTKKSDFSCTDVLLI